VAEVAARTAQRVENILRAHGRLLMPRSQDADPPQLELDEPGFAACYAAAARGVSIGEQRPGQPPLRLFVTPEPSLEAPGQDDADPVAEVLGINLHARQSVNGTDRRQLERLCRYTCPD
jgi:hypothetical protein